MAEWLPRMQMKLKSSRRQLTQLRTQLQKAIEKQGLTVTDEELTTIMVSALFSQSTFGGSSHNLFQKLWVFFAQCFPRNIHKFDLLKIVNVENL